MGAAAPFFMGAFGGLRAVDDEVNGSPFHFPSAVPIYLEHEQYCPFPHGILAERSGCFMVELVTEIAAIASIAVAAAVTTAAVLSNQRKERSRVLVPVRSRNGRR